MSEINLVPSKGLATENICDDREYVFFDSFIQHFSLSEFLALKIKSGFQGADSEYVVEKYIHGEFVNRLDTWVFQPQRQFQDCRFTPIVTTDGWVYWTKFSEHQVILRALSLLYSGGKTADTDFPLHEGLCWQVGGADPSKLFISRNYKQTTEDKQVLSAFTVVFV